jgi:hypothetical protein
VSGSPQRSPTHDGRERLASRSPGSKGQFLSARGARGLALYLNPSLTLATQIPDFDRAASRLLLALDDALDSAASFPLRVEAAAVVESFTSPALRGRGACWFAARLRAGAKREPGLRLPPSIFEPILIVGLAFRVERELLRDSPDLLSLLPSLLEFVLVYYLDPVDLGPLIAARQAPEARTAPGRRSMSPTMLAAVPSLTLGQARARRYSRCADLGAAAACFRRDARRVTAGATTIASRDSITEILAQLIELESSCDFGQPQLIETNELVLAGGTCNWRQRGPDHFSFSQSHRVSRRPAADRGEWKPAIVVP